VAGPVYHRIRRGPLAAISQLDLRYVEREGRQPCIKQGPWRSVTLVGLNARSRDDPVGDRELGRREWADFATPGESLAGDVVEIGASTRLWRLIWTRAGDSRVTKSRRPDRAARGGNPKAGRESRGGGDRGGLCLMALGFQAVENFTKDENRV
jgi:hypothetical protein